jgi:transcriptional regulator with GAF, ATPase, and Fis domain
VILSCAHTLSAAATRGRAAHEPHADLHALVGFVREHILAVLRDTGGVVGGPAGAAARLDLKRTTLQAMMRRVGIAPLDRSDGARPARRRRVRAAADVDAP